MSIRERRAAKEHRITAERLSPYLDGELSPGEIARVEKHLQECAECRAELASLQETVSLFQQLAQPDLPRSFVLPRSVQGEQRRFKRWEVGFGALRTASLVVTVLLVLFVSGDFILGSNMRTMQPQTLAVEAIEQPDMEMAEAPAEEWTEKEAPLSMTGVEANSVPAPQAAPPVAPQPEAILAKEAPALGDGASGMGAEGVLPESQPMALGAPEQPMALPLEGAPAQPNGAPAVRALAPGVPVPKTSGARSQAVAEPVEETAAKAEADTDAEGTTEKQSDAPKASADAVAPTAMPQPTPEPKGGDAPVVAMAPTTALPQPTMAQVSVPVESEPRSSASRDVTSFALRWAAWNVLRTVALALFGVLLMLVAALIWVAQKRRV